VDTKTRHILLIGGAGYIGAEMSKDLLKLNYKVRVLDVFLYKNKQAITSSLKSKNFSFVNGDFRDDKKLLKALKGISDVVLLAGLVGDPITKKYPKLSNEINYTGMKKCINNLNKKGLNRVIFISTCSNYGMRKETSLASENCKLNPLSLYAKSKVAIEKFILKKKGKVDYNPVILRFATAFGLSSRMRFDLTVSQFTRDLALKNDLLVYDADTWRPYCHVKDFSRLVLKVLTAEKKIVSFQVFNAGGNINNFTKRGIIKLILKFLPKAKVRFKLKGQDPRNYRVSFKKVKKILKFKPKYTVTHGIKELITCIKKNKFSEKEFINNQFGNFIINK